MVFKERRSKKSPPAAPTGLCSSLTTVFKTLLIVIVLPPILNYAGLQREQEFFTSQSNSSIIDIGFGQSLFLQCSGHGGGRRPYVILNAPTGSTSDTMLGLAGLLESQTTVCRYDRAGLGLSEAAPAGFNASDPGQMAVLRGPPASLPRQVSDLRRLISFAEKERPESMKRPLVVVGSETGALIAQAYALSYPQDVLQLVLIDPLHPALFKVGEQDVEQQESSPWLDHWYGHLITSLRLLQISAGVGLNRFALLAGQLSVPDLGLAPGAVLDEVVTRQKNQICDPFHLQVVIDEYRMMNASLHSLTELRLTKQQHVPVTVVSGSYYRTTQEGDVNKAWLTGVKAVVDSHPGSKHVVMPGPAGDSLKNPQKLAEIITGLVNDLSI